MFAYSPPERSLTPQDATDADFQPRRLTPRNDRTHQMTLAVGVRTPEGVLCATDSMRADWSTPWPTIDLDSSKFKQLGTRLYYIASGYFRSDAPLLPLGTDNRSVEDLAPAMWENLRGRAVPAQGTHDGLQRYPALLIAGGPAGEAPELMLLRSDREPERVPGDILVAGAMSDWAEAHQVASQPAPATLQQAAALAEALCRGYLTDSYRGWGIEELLDPAALRREVSRPGGAIPPSAFPLHLVAITADEVTELEVAR
jgi:hypothetical protein